MSKQNKGTSETYHDFLVAIQKKDATHDELNTLYDKWDTYDQDMAAIGYIGPKFLCEYFNKHARAIGLQKDALILDVAAGTGTEGIMLKEKYGYTNIDAIDASQPMLDKALETGVFRSIYCCRIGEGYKLPMADDTYDAAVMTGAIMEGHIKVDAFRELIRVVKPGGLVVNVMRENFIRDLEEYRKMQPTFKKWADENLWECLEEAIPPVKYCKDYDALVHVYRVL